MDYNDLGYNDFRYYDITQWNMEHGHATTQNFHIIWSPNFFFSFHLKIGKKFRS